MSIVLKMVERIRSGMREVANFIQSINVKETFEELYGAFFCIVLTIPTLIGVLVNDIKFKCMGDFAEELHWTIAIFVVAVALYVYALAKIVLVTFRFACDGLHELWRKMRSIVNKEHTC